MPSPKECSKIIDPVERKKCLTYQGKYKKGKKASPAPRAVNPNVGY